MLYPLANTVPLRFILTLVEHLDQQGLSASKSLRVAGFAADVPSAQASSRVAPERLALVLQDLATRLQRTDLGFEMGKLATLSSAGPLGQILLCAPSVADGMARFAPYVPLITPSFRMRYAKAHDVNTISLSPTRALPYDVTVMLMECMVVSTFKQLQFLTQRNALSCAIEMSWVAPPHAARYRELRGARLEFGATTGPGAAIRLPASIAEARLPQADAVALDAAEASCRQLLASLDEGGNWARWVRHMLETMDGHFPNQEELATLIDVCARTLARRLEEEGVTYRDLAREVRHERAKKLLANTSPSIIDIARTLGYSDSANFSRAFKAIEGGTPAAYRAALAGKPLV